MLYLESVQSLSPIVTVMTSITVVLNKIVLTDLTSSRTSVFFTKGKLYLVRVLHLGVSFHLFILPIHLFKAF